MCRLTGFSNRTVLGGVLVNQKSLTMQSGREKQGKHEGFSRTTPKINTTKGSDNFFLIIKMLERKVQCCRFALMERQFFCS